MNRYVVSVLLLVFVIGGIGAYYAYAASDRLPAYKLVTIEGNAAEGEAIVLSGSYGGRLRSKFLTVSGKGSEYTSDQSFFQRDIAGARSWYMQQPGIAGLIRDHREFMRGNGAPEGLYHDQEWLIYGEASVDRQLTLKLKLLDLRTNRITQYKIAAGDQPGKSNSYVADVQRQGNEVHIMTRTLLISENGTAKGIAVSAAGEQYNDFVVDLSTGKLLRKIHIDYGLKPKKDIELRVALVTPGPYADPGTYSLFSVYEEQYKEGTDGYQSTTVGSHSYVYAYRTGKLTALPLEVIDPAANSNITYQITGELLYMLTNGEDERKLYRIDLASGKPIGGKTIVSARQLGADELGMAVLRDNRVYLLLHKSKIPQVVVLNAEDGAVLYRGETKFVGPASDAAKRMDELTLLNVQFRS